MSADTLLEQFVASLNASVFLAEFAFSGSELSIPGLGTIEIADHLVLLDDLGILFQLKERDSSASTELNNVAKWFANKIRKKAVLQMRSTREHLRTYAGSTLRNQRGHDVPLSSLAPTTLHGVVIYRIPTVPGFVPERFYDSKSAGFIHFFRDTDYLSVCQLLVTPTEIADYLAFRRELLSKWPDAKGVSEAALVGQFIAANADVAPEAKYEGVLAALQHDAHSWDMSYIASKLGSKIAYREGDASETSHYRILAEFAKLGRSELREFKKRFDLALLAVRADRFELPYRFACPRTDCGFLILPMVTQDAKETRQALTNLSFVSKYVFDVSKHVSLSILYSPKIVDIEWMYLEGANEPNPLLDEKLKENFPFRATSGREMPRYFLDTEALNRAIG
jgi:hypothetical protein